MFLQIFALNENIDLIFFKCITPGWNPPPPPPPTHTHTLLNTPPHLSLEKMQIKSDLFSCEQGCRPVR